MKFAAEAETRDHETVQARVGKNGGGNADNVSFRFNVDLSRELIDRITRTQPLSIPPIPIVIQPLIHRLEVAAAAAAERLVAARVAT